MFSFEIEFHISEYRLARLAAQEHRGCRSSSCLRGAASEAPYFLDNESFDNLPNDLEKISPVGLTADFSQPVDIAEKAPPTAPSSHRP